MKFRIGEEERESQNMTTRTGKLGKDSYGRIVGTGHPGQDTVRTGSRDR
jgi:hypothetical protein